LILITSLTGCSKQAQLKEKNGHGNNGIYNQSK
jgi:hypothetical protein